MLELSFYLDWRDILTVSARFLGSTVSILLSRVAIRLVSPEPLAS